ncbi:hypothetical protein IW262DRAFT_293459 [Armillaria fumosa]|nr:hypothetical protein IW262DRAFT_293459 [Armillaria fumosa]
MLAGLPTPPLSTSLTSLYVFFSLLHLARERRSQITTRRIQLYWDGKGRGLYPSCHRCQDMLPRRYSYHDEMHHGCTLAGTTDACRSKCHRA